MARHSLHSWQFLWAVSHKDLCVDCSLTDSREWQELQTYMVCMLWFGTRLHCLMIWKCIERIHIDSQGACTNSQYQAVFSLPMQPGYKANLKFTKSCGLLSSSEGALGWVPALSSAFCTYASTVACSSFTPIILPWSEPPSVLPSPPLTPSSSHFHCEV